MYDRMDFHEKLKYKMDQYVNQEDYQKALQLADDIGAMLWGIIIKL